MELIVPLPFCGDELAELDCCELPAEEDDNDGAITFVCWRTMGWVMETGDEETTGTDDRFVDDAVMDFNPNDGVEAVNPNTAFVATASIA